MLFMQPLRRKRARNAIEPKSMEVLRRVASRPIRGLCTRNDKSPPWRTKASETRRTQEQYVQRRRAFLAWLTHHPDVAGALLPRKRTRTFMTVRLQNLHPALELTVLDTSVCITVSFDGQVWDVLRDFDSAPKKATGGYVDAFVLPDWVVVYPNLQALWEAEVFLPFKEWFENTLSTAEVLILSGKPGRSTWAELAKRDAPVEPNEYVRIPFAAR
jgi:hypothetical protein